jgi:hypothetical protein
VFNLLVSYPNSRAVYAAFADLAWPGADWLVRVVIMPIAGPFTLAVVAFEMVAGLLLLGNGRRARAGLWAALVWLIVLIPFLGVYALANAAFILFLLRLFGSSHDRSLLEMIHESPPRRLAPRSQPHVNANATGTIDDRLPPQEEP